MSKPIAQADHEPTADVAVEVPLFAVTLTESDIFALQSALAFQADHIEVWVGAGNGTLAQRQQMRAEASRARNLLIVLANEPQPVR